jgi:TonB family protein
MLIMVETATSFALECAWKVTVILLAAGGLSILLRRAAASIRHLVWTCAIAGALLIPIGSTTLPRWTVPLWRNVAPAPATALFSLNATDEARQAGTSTQRAATLDRGAEAARPVPRSRTFPLAAIWIAGMAAVLLHFAWSRVGLVRLRRQAIPARGGVASLAECLRERMGLRMPVEVLETGTLTTPVTWGILRPVILIPSVAAEENPQRLRAILTHELAHIARRDSLWQLFGQLACALYWFHPLTWLADRRALALRERAADDLVLQSGECASAYAGHLVALARALSVPRACGSLAIARPSNLEQRVRAILDPSVPRTPRSRTLVLASLAVAAAGIMAIASARPAAAQKAAANPGDFEAKAQAASAAYDFDTAAALLGAALEARKQQFGGESIEYARALAKLGALNATWDRSKDAAECYSRALPILERRLGPNDPELFAPLRFLALDAQVRKDLPEAEKLYQRAIEIQRSNQIAGPEAALALNDLAILKLGESDSSSASQFLEEALRAAPKDSPERAAALRTQAEVLRRMGRNAEADETLAGAARALAASQRTSTQTQEVASGGGVFRIGGGVSAPMETFRVGGGVSAPVAAEKHEPQYSSEARINKVQGTVKLSIVVGSDGIPRDFQVIRSLGLGLDQKVIEAVRLWRFKPGIKEDHPVNVLATVEVNFRLL